MANNKRAMQWVRDRLKSARRDSEAHPEGHTLRSFYEAQAIAYENVLSLLEHQEPPASAPASGAERMTAGEVEHLKFWSNKPPVPWSHLDPDERARWDRHAIEISAPAPATPPGVPDSVRALSEAAEDVLAERRRQVSAEGWTPEHDDQHDRCELATAAACYATAPSPVRIEREWTYPDEPKSWPWHWSWWKPSFYRRNLVKAGALIIAEIERWDRANKATGQSVDQKTALAPPPEGALESLRAAIREYGKAEWSAGYRTGRDGEGPNSDAVDLLSSVLNSLSLLLATHPAGQSAGSGAETSGSVEVIERCVKLAKDAGLDSVTITGSVRHWQDIIAKLREPAPPSSSGQGGR